MREIHKDKGLNGYDHNNGNFPYHIGSEVLDGRRTEIETTGDENGEVSALLNAIAYMIGANGGVVERLGNSLNFQAGSGRTYVEVRDIHTPTIDRQEVSHVVLIRTELPELPIENRGLVVMNTLASLGALVREGDSERVSIVSRCSVFKGDDDAWRLYFPLIASTTVLQGSSLINAIKSSMGLETVRLNISDDQDNPSRWSRPDFEFAKERLKQSLGLFSTAGDRGLTAEIPWEPGGISAMAGDVTSLLTFQADMPHPALGSGLFYKLELPIHFAEDELVFFANRLNHVEFESVDAPPFFGAWCSHLDSGRLCHVGFWPNLLYQPGTVLNLGVWMFYRNRQAVAFISNNRK